MNNFFNIIHTILFFLKWESCAIGFIRFFVFKFLADLNKKTQNALNSHNSHTKETDRSFPKFCNNPKRLHDNTNNNVRPGTFTKLSVIDKQIWINHARGMTGTFLHFLCGRPLQNGPKQRSIKQYEAKKKKKKK